jgi:hypothetical protein
VLAVGFFGATAAARAAAAVVKVMRSRMNLVDSVQVGRRSRRRERLARTGKQILEAILLRARAEQDGRLRPVCLLSLGLL